MPVPARAAGQDHVYHVYAVRVRDRDWVRKVLGEQGIQTGVHYPIPVHLQPAYAGLGYGRGAFPVTERLAEETLSLPIFPEISEAQISQVSDALIRITAPVAA